MTEIIPALIPHTFKDIEDTISSIGGFTNVIQIDIVDGVFVPFVSWPYPNTPDDVFAQFQSLKHVTGKCSVEIDAMIQNPELYMSAWIESGVSRIIVHVESTEKLAEIVGMNRKEVKLGLSLNNDTLIEAIPTVLFPHIDFIQVMGIKAIGSQGQPFDDRALARIRTLKILHKDLSISVDGSVNETTLPLLRSAGAERFVVGSAILNAPDPKSMHEALMKIIA